MYALLRNVLNEFVGDPQESINQLEELVRQINGELGRIGATGGDVVFRCTLCGQPVAPILTYHTGTANLCMDCGSKFRE